LKRTAVGSYGEFAASFERIQIMTSVRLLLLLIVVFVGFFSANPVSANTVLYFESTPESWVGHGITLHATIEDGYVFGASRNFDNGVNFTITRASPHDHWELNLAAPFNATIVPGLYEGAARFPFQDADQPGLTFSGNHRGNNRNAGFFEVFEAIYSPSGAVERFAVDFTQYGEENPNWVVWGKMRYNSEVPIPEPTTVALLCAGVVCWTLRRNK
jgi:hypothetical protein